MTTKQIKNLAEVLRKAGLPLTHSQTLELIAQGLLGEKGTYAQIKAEAPTPESNPDGHVDIWVLAYEMEKDGNRVDHFYSKKELYERLAELILTPKTEDGTRQFAYVRKLIEDGSFDDAWNILTDLRAHPCDTFTFEKIRVKTPSTRNGVLSESEVDRFLKEARSATPSQDPSNRTDIRMACFRVVVLYENEGTAEKPKAYDPDSLEVLAYDINEDNCIGDWEKIDDQALRKGDVIPALLAVGNDGEFFSNEEKD